MREEERRYVVRGLRRVRGKHFRRDFSLSKESVGIRVLGRSGGGLVRGGIGWIHFLGVIDIYNIIRRIYSAKMILYSLKSYNFIT